MPDILTPAGTVPAPCGTERAVVAMSGGVDSSVAAALLLEVGWHLRGVFLQLFDPPSCCVRPEADAAAVAEKLGIEFEVFDLRKRFEDEIITPFCKAYRAGRTPNPCVFCNPGLKLGALLDYAIEIGSEAVATGHYAEVLYAHEVGRWHLRRPHDMAKDQTYYLYRLDQWQLARFLTPLANLTKDQARCIARDRGLPVADRAESQEICFVPDDDYRAFLRLRTPDIEHHGAGEIVDTEGRVLGLHRGVHAYTIGQRRGLGLGGLAEPLYVVALRPERREVVVGRPADLMSSKLEVDDTVWGGIDSLKDGDEVRAHVKIRYRSAAAPARLLGLSGGGVRVEFDEPRRAVTPGQSAVFYDADEGDTVLGGGVIRGAL